MDLEEQFKGISIRGRYAFGVCCIEQYLKENELGDIKFTLLLDKLWSFTTSNKLDVWDREIKNLDPLNILEEHPDNKPEDYAFSEKEFYEFKKFYQSLDNRFIEMIGEVIRIGTSNLYGGTGDYSKFSLEPTIEVYFLATSILKDVPSIQKFNFTKFSEANGWGDKFEKDIFQ